MALMTVDNEGTSDFRSPALEMQDLDVFESDQRSQDLSRVSNDVSASALLGHVRLEAPSSRPG